MSVATIALVASQIGAPNAFEYWEMDRGIVIRALGLFFDHQAAEIHGENRIIALIMYSGAALCGLRLHGGDGHGVHDVVGLAAA